jgi:chromosome segregation ATPase
MKNYHYLLPFLFFLTSCVSKKEYSLLMDSKDALQKDYDVLKDARRERQTYADSLVRVNTNFTNASQEIEDWKNRYLSLNTTIENLNKDLANVRYQNEQLQKTASANNDALRTELANRMKELDAKERDLRLIETDINSFKDFKIVLTEKELKVQELSETLKDKDLQISELKAKIAELLRGGKKQ